MITISMPLVVNKSPASVCLISRPTAAFDTIDHSILLDRRSLWFGVHGTALNWFKSHLSDRLFCGKCSHDLSEPHQSCYGVPKALYSELCFSHCRPTTLLSVLLFPDSHSVTIYMLMTPSCSYPSSPPSSMKILLACKLLLAPSPTG